MPTTVPATGAVGLSAIETAFPNLASSNSLSSYRGRLPGMPTAAQSISYSQTRGLTAPTPTHALSAVGGTGVAVSSGGAFTLTAAPTNSMTLTLPSYLSTASSYHPGLAYYVASGSTLPQGFSLNASTGVVTVANANGASSAASFVVSACNSYSNSATIPLSLGACATPSASTSLGSVSLTSNTVTYALGSYFTDASGTAVTYTVTSNPNGNASVSGSTLSVVGANLGQTYNITVTATNGLGRTATNTISVTEANSWAGVAPYSGYNFGYSISASLDGTYAVLGSSAGFFKTGVSNVYTYCSTTNHITGDGFVCFANTTGGITMNIGPTPGNYISVNGIVASPDMYSVWDVMVTPFGAHLFRNVYYGDGMWFLICQQIGFTNVFKVSFQHGEQGVANSAYGGTPSQIYNIIYWGATGTTSSI